MLIGNPSEKIDEYLLLEPICSGNFFDALLTELLWNITDLLSDVSCTVKPASAFFFSWSFFLKVKNLPQKVRKDQLQC